MFGCSVKFLNTLRQLHEGMMVRLTVESEPSGVGIGNGVKIDFRLDGNLFKPRRLRATRKITPKLILELQYADDCA
ncbi:hypothetical protein Hamer_G000598, partial [Homarus americanus]